MTITPTLEKVNMKVVVYPKNNCGYCTMANAVKQQKYLHLKKLILKKNLKHVIL